MKITLSTNAIRARIQALIALKATLSNDHLPILTADSNFALNQHIVSHFLRALLSIHTAVLQYSITPADYMDNPAATDIMASAELKSDRCKPDAALIRAHLENYIADAVLTDLYAGKSTFEMQLHESRATTSLNHLADDLIVEDISNINLQRSI